MSRGKTHQLLRSVRVVDGLRWCEKGGLGHGWLLSLDVICCNDGESEKDKQRKKRGWKVEMSDEGELWMQERRMQNGRGVLGWWWSRLV